MLNAVCVFIGTFLSLRGSTGEIFDRNETDLRSIENPPRAIDEFINSTMFGRIVLSGVIKAKPAQSDVEMKEKSLGEIEPPQIEPPRLVPLLIGWILLLIRLIDFVSGVSSCQPTHKRPSDLLQHGPDPEVGPT